jgi:hypothetical protein
MFGLTVRYSPRPGTGYDSGEAQDPQRVEDLYIVEKDRKLKLLSEDSAIIAKIPKRVRTARIFADAEMRTLKEIKTKARNLETQAA